MQKSARLIKKYPNRRLYDTQASAYITLMDIKQLVLDMHVFQVIDAKSGEDITRSILLQIILEEESAGLPLFSPEMLSQIIRFYGHAAQSMVGKYLEASMTAFVNMQQQVQEQSSHLFGGDQQKNGDFWTQFLSAQSPAMQNIIGVYVDQSKKMFQEIQDQMQDQMRSLISGIATGHSSRTEDSQGAPAEQVEQDREKGYPPPGASSGSQ